MKVYIASDHGGFTLKSQLTDYFVQHNIVFEDLGPADLNPADDYPDYAYPLAMKVAEENAKGILLCRNGIGVSIVANKVNGIRAVATTDPEIAKTSREDDDTNILCLGQDMVSFDEAVTLVSTWLSTNFSKEERHIRRLQKISDIENKQNT